MLERQEIMLRREETSREEDEGPDANMEQTQRWRTYPNHVANDESGISNAEMADDSRDGERSHSSKSSKNAGGGRKSKRKKKRKKHRSNYNDNSASNTPFVSNGGSRETSSPTQPPTRTSKRKRNGRLVRLVSIDTKKSDRRSELSTISSITKTTSVPPLPRNQYATTLRRRAVRKQEDNAQHDSDEHGDISLGMKLIVAGGRVIIQTLNSLSDGLASPAQLAGVVQRGDVLLAIGNLSLANLPIDQLMEGLRPLSTPDSGGLYERFLDLRLEAGAGLDLLSIHEQEHARLQDNMTADAMLSMFPMVDQLSGTPLFGPEYDIDTYQNEKFLNQGNSDKDTANAVEEAKGEDIVLSDKRTLDDVLDRFSLDFDSLISAALAKERMSDRDRYESTFFDWRDDISDLLRTNESMEASQENNRARRLSKIERLEVGRKIMKITKALELNLEEMDKGQDVRSQKHRNSGFSIRSGSSSVVKRQYNMDGTITSFPSSYNSPLNLTIDDDSIGSDGSVDDVDSDKLLLGLAARDTMWRKLVITVLKKAADDIKNHGEEKPNDSSSPNGAIDLKNQLGSFLFRENTSRVLKRKVKSSAFPQQEITRVLFDLATFIATTAHDDITTFGGSSKISSLRSVATKGRVGGRASVRGDFLLAKRFILDEALPHWLKSFQPLKLDQRMILWPCQNNRTDYINVDSLTLESEGSHNSVQRKKRGSRETGNSSVAGHEADLKSETCFLVTYYCIEKIIGSERYEELSTMNGNSFILTYGAYLQIHTCLSFASFVKDKTAISDILQIASDDPNHRDAMKDIQKSNKKCFYDSNKLSCVLKCLEEVRFQTDEQRKLLLDLCVSGYPDIQPWQVRTALSSKHQSGSDETRKHCSDSTMEDAYYDVYLCNLLNPVDGHETAREDSNLLKEFCERSISIGPSGGTRPKRMENFLKIASPSSKYHNSYRRDLMMLLDLSSSIENHTLSLDLLDEIIGNGELSSNKEAFRCALESLRKIGSVSIVLCSKPATKTIGFDTLKQVLKLFENMSIKNSLSCQNLINVPGEICSLFQQWKIQNDSAGDDATMFQLIDFVVDVSSEPAYVVKALSIWSSNRDGNSLFPRLEHLLRRGIHFAVLHGELSGTLLRLKFARTTFKELDSTRDQAGQTKDIVSIWERMGEGGASIEK